jgi:hypothetical protein
MDSLEEDYFNGDEEEVPTEPLPAEEPVAVKPFELKRRRSTDDDGDDELLQIAQRLPHTKRISPIIPY